MLTSYVDLNVQLKIDFTQIAVLSLLQRSLKYFPLLVIVTHSHALTKMVTDAKQGVWPPRGAIWNFVSGESNRCSRDDRYFTLRFHTTSQLSFRWNKPDNNVWTDDWIRSCSSALPLVPKQEVKWGVGVPIITQQLPPSETWPIKKRVRDGEAHTPTRCLCNADASSGHGSILVAAWERRPAERHCNAWRGGESIVERIKPG